MEQQNIANMAPEPSRCIREIQQDFANNMAPEPSRCIREIQQDFANNLGYRREVIWDLLSADQADIMKDKIKQLIPDQDKGQKSIESIRETLFQNVWAQRKYTNRNSMTALIFVFVTKDDNNNPTESRAFSCHPVFRCRRCIKQDQEDSSECCMIFVDEAGRVYQNWAAYLKNNVLPDGIMIAPCRGIYTFDEDDNVQLEIKPTPANSLAQHALKTADTTSAVAGFASACVPIAALCTIPVAAPIMLGAAAVGLASAGYATVRSGANLIDRSRHEQSINVTDKQARASWLGVLAGTVGLGAAGATHTLTSVAAAGREISLVTELVVNGMNITTIVLSGTGLANGILDMILRYNDDEDITLLDVVQLSASLVLFTHSVTNFRLASTIINETHNSTIQDYRRGLSNRQRRAFDKVAKETIRIRGDKAGKIDIIRNVNDIPSKQYLNDIFKLNKEFNRQNVRPSFSSAGEGIVLNNEVHIDTQIVRNNVDTLSQVTQPIPASHTQMNCATNSAKAQNPLFANKGSANVPVDNGRKHFSAGVRMLTTSSVLVADGVRFALSDLCENLFEHIVNAESFENIITTAGEKFGGESLKFFLRLANIFIEMMLEEIESVLRTFISVESVLYRMMCHCVREYVYTSVEFLEGKSMEIIESVTAYYMSLNPNCYPELLSQCEHCSGYYNICNL